MLTTLSTASLLIIRVCNARVVHKMRSTESSKASSSITNSSTSIFSQEEFDPYMDDLEAMELGLCREVISSELYMPCHPSRDWVRCYIATTSPDNYRLGTHSYFCLCHFNAVTESFA